MYLTKFYKPVKTTQKENKNNLKLKAELVFKKTENRANQEDLDCVVTFFSLERGIDKLKEKSVLVLKRSNKVK